MEGRSTWIGQNSPPKGACGGEDTFCLHQGESTFGHAGPGPPARGHVQSGEHLRAIPCPRRDSLGAAEKHTH